MVPRIRQLAQEGSPYTLAVSLHAPDDELRDELVPINNRWPVAEVLDAAWRYADATGRRVSIEYALIKDINDQPERARMLANLLAGRLVHVNLIPLNPTPGSKWTASRPEAQDEFVRILSSRKIAVTVRDTRGGKQNRNLPDWKAVFFQAEDGIRDLVRSRGLGDVYKRQLRRRCVL